MNAEISITYESDREAEAVARAVSPDNVEIPPGLSVKTTRRKNTVFTRIECETRFQTFIATIDDLLEYVSIAERAFSAITS